jgi:thiol-disulfide isomerase/thioredoxin
VLRRTVTNKARLALSGALFSLLFLSAHVASAAPIKAPAVSLVTIDGRPITSASLKGKAYILNFFASWCPPCRSEVPDMVSLQKVYASKGFTFIGVAVNETEPAIRSFIKSNGINYPVAMVTPALVSTYSKYVEGGLSAIPTSIVVDASGTLTGVIVGARSREDFEKIIKTATAAKAVK